MFSWCWKLYHRENALVCDVSIDHVYTALIGRIFPGSECDLTGLVLVKWTQSVILMNYVFFRYFWLFVKQNTFYVCVSQHYMVGVFWFFFGFKLKPTILCMKIDDWHKWWTWNQLWPPSSETAVYHSLDADLYQICLLQKSRVNVCLPGGNWCCFSCCWYMMGCHSKSIVSLLSPEQNTRSLILSPVPLKAVHTILKSPGSNQSRS